MTTVELFKNAKDVMIVEAGRFVFEKGQPGDRAYAIIDGQIDIVLDGRTIDTAGPGSVIGEMALIDSAPRSASALAVTAVKLAPIDERRFMFLVQQTPYFAIQIMQIMSDRLRRWLEASR
jgi:CRP-like cAMP-binding protein